MGKRLGSFGLVLAGLVLAACGGGSEALPLSPVPPAPTLAAAAPTSAPAPTIPPAAQPAATVLSPVPRNRTVILGWSIGSPIGVTNPLDAADYTHQDGNNLLWEGLAYYAVFADKEIPWLALSMDYTKPDFSELTIRLNPLARWNDGVPVTAQDVIFTLQAQLDDDTLPYHNDVQQFVQTMQPVDDHTVVLTFKKPAPRFKFEVLTLKFDTGLPIVPAHYFQQGKIDNSSPGGLEITHSGPYNLVYWDDQRKIYDLRPDWWAVGAGLMPLPAVKRVIVVNENGGLDTIAEQVANNDFDETLDVRTAVLLNMLRQNPKVTTYTGSAAPYGYLDWWTNSLWVNTQLAPYSDARVRRAISLAIDRDRLDQELYGGAPVATIYPFPLYPGLQRFVVSPDIKALEAKYQPRKFDLAESAQLMTEAGFTKNADGLWAKDGQTFNATINGFSSFHADIGAVLVEMLRRAGFDSSGYYASDAFNNMTDGSPGLYLFGHGGSVVDPYTTFAMFHSRNSAPAGTSATMYHFSRYSNPAYDQIVDAMAVLPADDPQFHALAAQAMEIYWRDVIDIPVVQWLHLIPYNQTYWTNWPTQANPALGTNGAFWAQTGMLVITSLKPAQ